MNDPNEIPLTPAEADAMDAVFEAGVEVQCKHCKFFVEMNFAAEDYMGESSQTFRTYVKAADGETVARYIHLDSGDTEHDHDAEPGIAMTSAEWGEKHPELNPYDGEDDSAFQARRNREFGGVVHPNPFYETANPLAVSDEEVEALVDYWVNVGEVTDARTDEDIHNDRIKAIMRLRYLARHGNADYAEDMAGRLSKTWGIVVA